MRPQSGSQPNLHSIVELGPIAARVLARMGTGRVIAVFERCAYVDVGGELICIAAQAVGSGALNALVASADAFCALRASPHLDVECNGARLLIGSAFVDFATSRRWHPLPVPWPLDSLRLARGVAATRSAARGRVPDEGVGFLVAGSDSASAIAAAVRRAAARLRHWLLARDGAKSVPASLATLIGLGPGLTPSGDDFVGGALVALHTLGEHERAAALAAWLRPQIHRTHPISAAHLAAACEGLAGEALHACIDDIANARDPRAGLERIAAIGHTSGWDALAGVLVVADAIAQACEERVAGAAQRARSTCSANSAACALDGATMTPAPSSVRTCRE